MTYFDSARPQLAAQLNTKRQAMASGMYLQEPVDLLAAIRAYGRLNSQLAEHGLEITADLGNATTPDSRNVVRWAQLSDGRRVVAKVVGNIEEAGEGTWLEAANELGLPTVPLVAHGIALVKADGRSKPVQWVVTEAIDAPTLQSVLPADRDEATVVDVISRLAPVAAQFHEGFARDGFTIRGSQTWEQRMQRHLRWTNPAVEEAGLSLPSGWARGLRVLSTAAPAQQLHGDPAPVNTLVTADGRFLLFDPPGAIVGPREADFGQMAAQVGNLKHHRIAVETICRLDPTLDPDLIAAAVGFAFLQWAGYSAKEHSNSDAENAGVDPRDHAEVLVSVAAELTAPVCARVLTTSSTLNGGDFSR